MLALVKSLISSVCGDSLQQFYTSRLWNKCFKNSRELDYWKENLDRMELWLDGTREYHFPFPSEGEKANGGTHRENAVRTYIQAELAHGAYKRDMRLGADAFVGKKIGDVGAGPMPLLLVFDDCERWSIDHLMDEYEGIGYPLGDFRDQVNFLQCSSEAIAAEDDSFDVMLSCNALDHVDDFEKTAAEMLRVLKPGGWLHILLNYHEPTQTETQVLTDDRVHKAFAGMELRQIYEIADGWGFEGGKSVLWTNIPDACLDLEAANS